MNTMASRRAEALDRLATEEADAWFEYLESTRSQPSGRYLEVEPWAWARLTRRRQGIKKRRALVVSHV